MARKRYTAEAISDAQIGQSQFSISGLSQESAQLGDSNADDIPKYKATCQFHVVKRSQPTEEVQAEPNVWEQLKHFWGVKER